MDKVQETIREALQAATPGPWARDDVNGIIWNGEAKNIIEYSVSEEDENIELIANAPEWLYYLLTKLDAAKRAHRESLERIEVAALKAREDFETVKQQLDALNKENEQLRTSEVFKSCLAQEEIIKELRAESDAAKQENDRLKKGIEMQFNRFTNDLNQANESKNVTAVTLNRIILEVLSLIQEEAVNHENTDTARADSVGSE